MRAYRRLFKDSGLDCSVTKCRIDGFNMHWYNGAGVNLEMHAGYDPAYIGTCGSRITTSRTAPQAFAQDGNTRVRGTVTLISRRGPNPRGIVSCLTSRPAQL